jgi:DNA-binding beta-propeller fold protein YncE
MRTRTPLLALLALTACDPWNTWPGYGWEEVDGELWDSRVVNVADGSYVRLPHAGRLVRVNGDGSFDAVDLDGASPRRVLATPDEQQVLVFAQWQSCDDPDPDIVSPSDCDDEDLVLNAELVRVQDAVAQDVYDVPAHMNSLAWSLDGSVAVAYLDYEAGSDIEIDGVVDLTEVLFIPLDGGTPRAVSIGFSPRNILFTPDDGRAVIMSRSEVVVVSLDTFEVVVTYPLVLDADQEVNPKDAVLTPDGRHALVSVEGSSELYKLDLQSPTIDIEDLDAPPSDMIVSEEDDAVVIVYNSLNRVDVLDLSSFELKEPVELDDPMNGVLLSDGRAFLYNASSSSHDVYTLDLDTTELEELRVENPVDDVRLSPGGRYVVSALRPEGTSGSGLEQYQDANWGLSVVDLDENEGVSLVLESEPVGLELVEQGDTTYALVLLDGRDTVLQLDLSAPSQPTELDLEAPPTGIGALPDGRFSITHDAPLGLITFLDPATGDTQPAAGFATVDLFAEDTLPRRDAQEN